MAFEPMYDELKNDYRKKLVSAQTAVETRLTAEAGADFAGVLCVGADAVITGFEALSGEARYGGRVNYKLLYLDSSAKCRCLEYSEDFNGTLASPDITPAAELQLRAAVIDADTVSVNAAEIKLAAVAEITLFKLACDEIRYLKGDPELYTRKSEISCSELAARLQDEFVSSEEFDIKDEITQVLMCETSAYLGACRPEADCLALSGKIITALTYLTADDDIKSRIIVGDFSQELPCSGARAGDTAECAASVSKSAAKLQLSDAGNSVIRDCAISVDAAVYRNAVCEAVVDAFSVSHELQVVSESFLVNRLECSLVCPDKIEGSAALADNIPSIDTVLAVCGNRINIANAYTAEGRTVLEGLVNCNIIYYNAEKQNKFSVSAELPYSITLNSDSAREGMTVLAGAVITDIHARQRRAGEVDISVNVMFSADLYGSVINYVIKEVEQGAQRDTSLSAFAIHITREGELLWDVAKSLCTTPELIMMQNPGLKLPLIGGERILVYRQQKARF
ncbi:MAG: DUF3794 domain-containing protein [Clostridiales bacterium]|jgi:hypothetical protein|nr:DUF3794 domain-containing protein [Clostridiales bacterium]